MDESYPTDSYPESTADEATNVVDREPDSAPKMKHRIDTAEQLAPPKQLSRFREIQLLMNVLNDENADLTKFCESIRRLPQIQDRIFRNARSILAGRGNQILELRHAIAMVGLRKVREILEQAANAESNAEGDDLLAEGLPAESGYDTRLQA